MPDYKAIARKAARKYGIPEGVFLRQIQQESGWNPRARSSAGALGIAQFMPATARGFHIDPLDPVQSLFAAAKYDRQGIDQYGSIARALSAYNSGRPDAYKDPGFAHGQTYNYVRSILSGPDVTVPSRPAGAPPGSRLPDSAPAGPLPGIDPTVLSVLNAGNRMFGIQPLVAQASQVGAGPPSVAPVPGAPPDPLPAAAPGKWVKLAGGADRKGVRTNPAVLQFVAKIGRSYGRPLVIGTGTNHNRFVVGTTRESQHWTGHAADIPADGSDLLRLGRLALIAAGMPRAQAMKQSGGVYNIGRYQILFRTNVGGNHFNHLHVGVH
jgi:hypothetical protein